jgi:non-ribosomal peptide synthetase component F
MNFLLQHLLIEAARHYPEYPAVVTDKEAFSYRELLERANQISRLLIENGCRPGDRVAIYCDKSAASVLSIYAILNVGCTYVPLDPTAPPDRLRYIVGDCGVRCVLLTASKRDLFSQVLPPGIKNSVAVIVDGNVDGNAGSLHCHETKFIGLADILAQSTQSLPPDPVIETDLAYILYTSGSTGRPKGVMISHLNALTFIRWAAECADVRHSDRVSNHAPLHFDLSIFDIFACALAGATLYPVPTGVSMFPMRMADWIEINQISIWYSVPSVLSMMVRQGKIDRYTFGSLRSIIFAGEVFPIKYLRPWVQHLPHTRFFNWYGPTETNVITSQ